VARPEPIFSHSKWESVVAHLAIRLTPGQLRLSVVYNTLDHATSQLTLQSISKLPLLVSCAIRLGWWPDRNLRRLAETTIRQVTGQPCLPNKGFPRPDLPGGLQLWVLSYSGLLTPGPHRMDLGSQPLERPFCCLRCTETLGACCRSSLHGAFTSTQCVCWSWPQDLFLADGKIRRQALEIFYNQYVVPLTKARKGHRPEDYGALSLTVTISVASLRLPY
jgi:hypothetical protein